MCGIAGIAGGAPPDRTLLGRMAATMENRGPDGEGVWADDTAGFAFRRLAIIDLHERSSQPMHLGPLHLVFNGEIYNYRELRDELRGLGHEFHTEGDAEVILHSWAELFVEVDDRLCVAVSTKAVTLALEIAAQLAIVVDLAVEHDPNRPIFIG